MYVSVDGDDIGRMLTQKIYLADDGDVKIFSVKVTDTFNAFASQIIAYGGTVLFCAGDSILFKVDDNIIEQALQYIKSDIFTLSIGVGNTLREAHWSLNVAKSLGKNRVVYFESVRNDIFGG